MCGDRQECEAPKIGGDFWFTMFMNNNKGQDSRYYPFTGDLAAFVLYNNDLTDRDKKNVRDYFDGIYDFKNTKVEPKPKAEPAPK